jgi:hypothetical protein
MFDKDPNIKILTKDGTMKNFYTFPGGLIHGTQVPTALHATKNNRIIISTAEKDYKYTLSEHSHRQLVILTAQGKEQAFYEFNRFGKRLYTLPYRIYFNIRSLKKFIFRYQDLVEIYSVSAEKIINDGFSYSENV